MMDLAIAGTMAVVDQGRVATVVVVIAVVSTAVSRRRLNSARNWNRTWQS